MSDLNRIKVVLVEQKKNTSLIFINRYKKREKSTGPY